MSQVSVRLDDGSELVVGYDQPFDTFFAQLYAPGAMFDDAPLRTVGYHPTEQQLTPGVEHGPYPVATIDGLLDLVDGWGLSNGDVERAREALEADRS